MGKMDEMDESPSSRSGQRVSAEEEPEGVGAELGSVEEETEEDVTIARVRAKGHKAVLAEQPLDLGRPGFLPAQRPDVAARVIRIDVGPVRLRQPRAASRDTPVRR